MEAKNQGDAAAYGAEKLLKENEGKISAEAKAKIEAAIERLRTALKAEEVDEIKSATEDLNQSWHAVSQELYQQASGQPGGEAGPEAGPQAPPPPPPGQEGQAPEGEVIDAEFEVEDEGKK